MNRQYDIFASIHRYINNKDVDIATISWQNNIQKIDQKTKCIKANQGPRILTQS
jgi:hypothetical protein